MNSTDLTQVTVITTSSRPKRTDFKYISVCLCLTLFLSALEFTAVSTALPTIVLDLKGTDFIWVTSAYGLASTAVIPLIGGLAEIFGRKPTTLLIILFFAIGSAICGSAQNMPILIVGRTIQGLGGGAIVVITNIILADMIPLNERGGYGGLFSLTWCLAASLGALLGGVLTQKGQWRWLFYLNLPVCAVSGFLAVVFIKLPKPSGSWRLKLSSMDWIGNALIIVSSTLVTFGLTDGGVDFPWSSAHILAPLVIGALGFVPFGILNNRSSMSGYIQTFLNSIASVAIIYYIPVYFQSVKVRGPLLSGVLSLGLTTIAVFAVLGGLSVKIFKMYRPQIWFGWCLQIIGAGLLISIRFDDAKTIVYCAIFGGGAGINYAAQYYPIQSSLPVETTAQALAFHGFLRSFGGVWGITLGGTILQNTLLHTLPAHAEILSQAEIGTGLYSLIPQIKDFPEPLRSIFQQSFLNSLQPVWIWMTALSATGLLSSLLMQDVPMHAQTDQKWDPEAISSKSSTPDIEKAQVDSR